MSTILLWFWIILTILVVLFPLYFLAKAIFRAFFATTKHLQDQIDLAKDRIRQEPAPAFEENELSMEEDIHDKEITSSLLDEMWSEERNTLEDTIVDRAISTEPTSNDEEDDAFAEQETTTNTPPEQKLSSTYSAEKLAQTVDDIKYAALTYKERGKKDEYEKKLVEWISLVGDNEEFLTMLADHYFEAGHYVKAGTLLKKIININPENHRAIWQLWQIYAHDNDKETAKLLLEKARDLKNDNPKYLISLVEIYYEENNIRECITIVEKLSRLRPTNIDYLLTLWKLHEELNQPTKAHSYYMKVQELNPINDEAKQAIKRLL